MIHAGFSRPASGPVPILQVQSTALFSDDGTSDVSRALPSPVTANNTVFAFISLFGDFDVLTVTLDTVPMIEDIFVNAYSVATRIYRISNPSPGPGIVRVQSTGTSYLRWSIEEWSGLLLAGAVDQVVTTGISAPASATSGALSQANQLALSCVCNDLNNSPSQWEEPVGWTMSALDAQDSAAATSGAVARLITTSTSALTAAWGPVNPGSNYGPCGIVTYRGVTP